MRSWWSVKNEVEEATYKLREALSSIHITQCRQATDNLRLLTGISQIPNVFIRGIFAIRRWKIDYLPNGHITAPHIQYNL
jgi:hypothetical protein